MSNYLEVKAKAISVLKRTIEQYLGNEFKFDEGLIGEEYGFDQDGEFITVTYRVDNPDNERGFDEYYARVRVD